MRKISIMLQPEDIKLLRKALGYNTTSFGTFLGVTANTVARWEIGDRFPRRQMAERLSDLWDDAKQKGLIPEEVKNGKKKVAV